jgi:hypothetical protein
MGVSVQKSEFPLKIRISDIVAIGDKAAVVSVPAVEDAITAGATYDDLQTIFTLLALHEFMKERHCDPGFELEFT